MPRAKPETIAAEEIYHLRVPTVGAAIYCSILPLLAMDASPNYCRARMGPPTVLSAITMRAVIQAPSPGKTLNQWGKPS